MRPKNRSDRPDGSTRESLVQASLWRKWLILLLQLGKTKISLLATLSAATGYLLVAGRLTTHMFVLTAAVFLLAFGSCALNQYQERRTDRLMERTRSRPIPSGRLNPGTALFISLGLIFTGLVILLYGANETAFFLGTFAVAWYNGVYLYLKQKTAFAAVPGALVGAIPPALGWVSGGGTLVDGRLWAIATFFFIWQVPHFWLLFLDFADDYERAGLPSLRKIFTPGQLRRIVFLWIMSAAVSSLSIPLFGLVNSNLALVLLLSGTLWTIWIGVDFLRTGPDGIPLKAAFTRLNAYAFIVMFLLLFDVISSAAFLP